MGLWSHYVHVVSKAVLVCVAVAFSFSCLLRKFNSVCSTQSMYDFLKKAFLEGWGGGGGGGFMERIVLHGRTNDHIMLKGGDREFHKCVFQ